MIERRGMSWMILLDSEAVQALADPGHRKHRRVVDYAQVAASRKARGGAVSLAVPTAVRVEAGWDRTAPAWAFVNRLRINDIPLDGQRADAAAAIGRRTGVSVADAHLGAAMADAAQVTVVTSDPRDMHLVAEGKQVEVVAL
jgi:predicted nucleic acid-binding protein